jgi:dephospho-CoA kinase
MLSIALTGNIGAGKSAVSELFRQWGATIIDADELVHQAQEPGQPLLSQIAARFGSDLIQANGSLDRAALRSRVLADSRALSDLNALVHPEVRRRSERLLADARRRGDPIAVSVIPLLFESGEPAEFDAVVLVDAPDAVRRDRLLATREVPAQEIDRLIAAQLPAGPKRALSDYVIENDADLESLERQAFGVWQALIARA